VRRGHVDLGQPFESRERTDGVARLEHHAPVVQLHLTDGPRAPFGGLALQVRALGEPAARRARHDARGGAEPGEPEKRHALGATVPERTGGRAQHQSVDGRTMAAPHQERDGPAHRVADRNRALHAQFVQEARRVVGAVGQTEGASCAYALAVPAVVESDHAEVPAEFLVDAEPVEVGGGGPAVQQQHRRGVGRPVHLADERDAATGQVHRCSGWQVGDTLGRSPVADRHLRERHLQHLHLQPCTGGGVVLDPGAFACIQERLAER